MAPPAPIPAAPRTPSLSVRQALLLAFAVLATLVSAALLATTLLTTRRLARSHAEPLIAAMGREARLELHRMFDPLRHKVVEDYASIRRGRFATTDSREIKDLLQPGLYSIPQVDSMMLGDQHGGQFLVMRYSPIAYRSPLLRDVAPSLPPPVPGHLQFFTREFRPAQWGQDSRWTLWDEHGTVAVKSWVLPLTGYDGRTRPWHRAAMANFRDLTLEQAREIGPELVAWTDFYPLFTTKAAGISAAVAARNPAGEIQIVAYDLLVNEITQFAAGSCPTPNGQLFVVTDDNRLLGPPHDPRPDAAERRRTAVLQPVATAGYAEVATAVADWDARPPRQPASFRLLIGGKPWWAGFVPFEINSSRRLWIGVLLPESDLVGELVAQQRAMVGIGLLALVAATIVAFVLARRFAVPLAELAEESRRIAGLNLADAPRLRPRIREMSVLAQALDTMREALRRHIDDLNVARREIREQERQVRALADNSPDVIVRYDREGRHLFANPAFERATGIPPALVLGTRLQDLPFAPPVRQQWIDTLRRAVDSGTAVTLEFAFATPAGMRHFESRALPEREGTDAVATVLVVSRDITERVAAAEALRRSEERYRLLIESATVGIIVHQRGMVRYANPAALQLFGFQHIGQIAAGEPWEKYIAPEYVPELEARTAAVLRGETVPPHAGWQLVRADGTRRWAQSTLTRVEWDGAEAVLSFLRDITDLRTAAERQTELEQQLRQAQKLEAVGLLAGGIAHDFNNLLQIIAGSVHLATDPAAEESVRRERLADVQSAVDRAARLVRQLLTFSRRQPMQREHLELNAFVAEHLQLVQRVLPENIHVEITPAVRPLLVAADRGQLEQVFLNLVVNARDAMPGGGSLRIGLEPTELDAVTAQRLCERPGGPFARITIADTGHGMDAATLQRIFEPFFTTKARDKGSGLGLSVVYGIVRQHEGGIEVASEPGRGTTFVIHLPLAAASAPAAPAPAPTPAAPVPAPVRKSGAAILLAEDNEPIRRVAERMLQLGGYKVAAVEDGTKALELFSANPAGFDLLFLDVMMPGLSGFETAERCRARRPDIPVLFASGYAAESIAEDLAVPAGAAVLQKPYGADQLYAAVQALVPPRST